MERRLADRIVRVWASQRSDGSVHPERVDADTLGRRQRDITGEEWVMADQVHGIDVHRVPDDIADPHRAGAPLAVADVVVTQASGVALAVWAADCAPIALAAADGTLVAAHGGWRGLAAGVVDVAVEEATRSGGAVELAVLGPVIHPCCYAFGMADLEAVAAGLGLDVAAVRGTTAQGDLALDVPSAVEAALARHGVDLDVSGPCSGCDDRWFSHRVRAELGRHAVVIDQVAA
ncbi:MAG: polyphenol oxidase family protein [Ilumatobacter sp.]